MLVPDLTIRADNDKLLDWCNSVLRDPRSVGPKLRAVVYQSNVEMGLVVAVVEDAAAGPMLRRELRFGFLPIYRRAILDGAGNVDEILGAVAAVGRELGVGRPVFRIGTRDPLRHRR